MGQRPGQVDATLVADDFHGRRVSGASVSETVKISTRPPPSVNSGASHGTSSRPLTTTASGSGGSPSRSRRARLFGIGHHAAVALGAQRAGADHHGVDLGPEADQHLGVGVAADRP